ncbi:putative DM4/DM12 family-like protein 1 [Homarus americanus]|uniref:Putative DM4/DM12 family-like protein 1 n=1 Tax=Homarus americanus TaxID=6706 RepID=A0A8J5JWV0_HOMAM|nr:putative DM4/DM12 family-like protein 1 [Homarus americanus]
MTRLALKAQPMVTTWGMMVTLVHLAATQSIQITPSVSSNGGVTFPIFTPSVRHDQWTAESSIAKEVVVPPPDQDRRRSSYRSADTGQINKASDFNFLSSSFVPPETNVDNTTKFDLGTLTSFPGADNNAGGDHSYQRSNYKNHTGRFFTLNSGGTQTLDSLGATTSTALNSLVNINWNSVLSIVLPIALAVLILPQVATLFTSLISSTGTGTTSGTGYGSSYGRNIERGGGVLPVEPFTSILNQLDDALAQYDLDSTSCMQRAVCTYVAESEQSVKEGDADSSEMIVSGFARSTWLQTLVGKTSLTEAVEMGRTGANCQLQYPKCPFSVTGVLRFLATYASLSS